MNTRQAVEEGIIYWDYLDEILCHKKDGTVVNWEGTCGENVVQIREGRRSAAGQQSAFVTVYCKMQQLLCSNIVRWPSAVSNDGKTITIWLEDFSLGRNGYRRKFELVFVTENRAYDFFEAYTSHIMHGNESCPSFLQFQEGDFRVDKCGDGKEEAGTSSINRNNYGKEEGDSFDGSEGEHEEAEGDQESIIDEEKGKDEESKEDDNDNKKDAEDIDKGSGQGEDDDVHYHGGAVNNANQLKLLDITAEEPWGESQNLFQPSYPDEMY